MVPKIRRLSFDLDITKIIKVIVKVMELETESFS